MQRPDGITITFALMCVTTALDLFLIYRKKTHSARYLRVMCVLVAATYVGLWFYLQGSNWARWLVIFFCLQCLWIARCLFRPNLSISRLEYLTILFEAIFGISMIWYLNTPVVRAWFRSDHTAAPSKIIGEP